MGQALPQPPPMDTPRPLAHVLMQLHALVTRFERRHHEEETRHDTTTEADHERDGPRPAR